MMKFLDPDQADRMTISWKSGLPSTVRDLAFSASSDHHFPYATASSYVKSRLLQPQMKF
jgi:hypothetical protein